MDRGEPEARALARGLGGEERLEDAGERGRVHARAVVLDGEDDPRARLDDLAADLEVADDVLGARADGDVAPVGHGVAGVDREVEEHLLELARVDEDDRRGRFEARAQLDVLADQAAQHLLEARHDLVQVDDAGLQHLAAAEGEELARERLGAVAGGDHLLDLARLRMAGGRARVPTIWP